MSSDHDALMLFLEEIDQQIRGEPPALLGPINEEELRQAVDRLARLQVDRQGR